MSLAPSSVKRPARVHAQPSFVLHTYPYKETSLIIDVFTRDYGRLSLLAKGAKRPQSQLRNVLQTFQPLTLSWSGKSELQTLTGTEWVGGMRPLEKSTLLCGFYLNEIVIKLLHRHDPHPLLFDEYVRTIHQLGNDESAWIVLRKFELHLLKATGFIGDLSLCRQHKTPVCPHTLYAVDPEAGARPAKDKESNITVHGKTLLDVEAGDYSDITTQQQSKHLMRALLTHHLHGMPVHTRQILMDLQHL